MKIEKSLYFNKSLITTFILFLFLFITSTYIYNNDGINTLNNNNNIDDNNNNKIRSDKIIEHTKNLIDIGNSKSIYEESRAIAREYIRDYLIKGGIPKDNIIWNHFEWNERNADGKNITTTTWTGINIIIWINKTTATTTTNTDRANQPIRIIASNYDTKNWGLNNTSGAFDSLASAGLIIEEALELFSFQERESIRTGQPNDTPFMFILFDQEKPGSLGSRSFVDNNNIATMAFKSKIAYFLNVDAVGSHHRTIIQTLPYQHKHQTFFTPRWLAKVMVKSAYSVNSVDGITIGSPSIGSSIVYQAHRYHLNSVKYLGDEGPFVWAGVDSILLTDVDFFNNKDACNQEKPSDQPNNLDPERLKETADIVYRFLLNTRSSSSILSMDSSKIYTRYPTLNLLLSFFKKILNNSLTLDQYLLIGQVCFGYFQLLFISLFLLSFIYFTTFKKYRELVLDYEKCIYSNQHSSNNESTTSEKNIDISNAAKSKIIRGHRTLFLHLLLLGIVTLIDTVYAFEIICMGFLSLATFHINKINILTGLVSSAFCLNFIYKDIIQIVDNSTSNDFQISLIILIAIYITHSILIIIYGYDYSKKNEEFKKKLKLKKKN